LRQYPIPMLIKNAGKPQECKPGDSLLRVGSPSRLPFTYPYTGHEFSLNFLVGAGDV